MAIPTIVNIWVKDLGVWKKATPHVKVAGAWIEPEKVHVRDAGAFKVAWVDAERALEDASFISNTFDFSVPFSTGGGWRMNPDGSIETFKTPFDIPNSFSSVEGLRWLAFEVGHEFQVSFAATSPNGLDITPVLDTFLETTVVHELSTVNTAFSIEQGNFDVSFIDKNAPGPAPILKVSTVSIKAENSL